MLNSPKKLRNNYKKSPTESGSVINIYCLLVRLRHNGFDSFTAERHDDSCLCEHVIGRVSAVVQCRFRIVIIFGNEDFGNTGEADVEGTAFAWKPDYIELGTGRNFSPGVMQSVDFGMDHERVFVRLEFVVAYEFPGICIEQIVSEELFFTCVGDSFVVKSGGCTVVSGADNASVSADKNGAHLRVLVFGKACLGTHHLRIDFVAKLCSRTIHAKKYRQNFNGELFLNLVSMEKSNHFGKVYLIGAGPGDPGLLTVRGKSILEKADVVVYDRLVSPGVLSLCNPDAKMVDVGKMPTHHKVKQSEINKLLVKFAVEMPGATIARLKGGDPFVFGRGGEEALELVSAGVEFEIVPGVTSAIAVPAYAGIPVSHRGIATSFHIITGHEKLDERTLAGSLQTRDERNVIPATEPESLSSKPLGLDFEALARCPGTLIFLMGIANMDFIAHRLMECGKDPKTPLAFIEKGTTPKQRTVMATLETAGETIVRENVTAPAITIMGGVVELGKTLAWKKNLPLSGKRLVVTRAAKQASGITARLTALGAEVIETPMIETRTLDCPLVMRHPEPVAALASHVIASPEGAWQSRSADFNSLANFDILAFTSTNGVESFFKQLFDAGYDVRVLAGKKIASVGKITEKKLLEYGIRCDYVPEDHTGEGLGMLLRSILDERTLVNSLQTRDERDVMAQAHDSIGSAMPVCEQPVTALASHVMASEQSERGNPLDESRILLLQGNLADDTLLKLLPKATRWVVYETLPVAELPEWKREAVASADAVVFASTSAVENFVNLMSNVKACHSERSEESSASMGPSLVELAQDDFIKKSPHTSFCIGRMTESAARKHGFNTVTSDETTMDSLVKKIVEYYTTSPNH